MKTIFSLIVLCLFVVKINAQNLYKQYFDGTDTVIYQTLKVEIESPLTNIWQIGKPQKTVFDSAATKPNAIVTDSLDYYPINANSSFYVKMDIWSSWGVLAVRWKQKLDLDKGNDGGIVEYSLDKGATWVNAFNNPYVYNFYGFDTSNKDTLENDLYAFSGTDSTWKDIWLCLDLSWAQSISDSVFFKFTLKTDATQENKEGWIIDNMNAQLTMIHTVAEKKADKYLNVYPNPVDDNLQIDIQKMNEFHIIEKMELFDDKGILVESWKNIPTKFYFNTKKYKNGNYFLVIKTNKKEEKTQIVINHN